MTFIPVFGLEKNIRADRSEPVIGNFSETPARRAPSHRDGLLLSASVLGTPITDCPRNEEVSLCHTHILPTLRIYNTTFIL